MKSVFTRSFAFTGLALAAMVATTTSAHAAPIAVGITGTAATNNCGAGCTNPSYEIGQGYGTSNWSSNNYAFIYSSVAQATGTGTFVDHGGAVAPTASPLGFDTVKLWSVQTPPVSGNFLGLDTDGSYGTTVSIDLGTLAAGTYTVTFDWADAMQNNYSTPGGVDTFDMLTVDMTGAAAQSTAEVWDANESSTAFIGGSETFTTSGGDEVLSFAGFGGYCTTGQSSGTCAAGNIGSTNVPSFALLDNVAYTYTPPSGVPEPNSLMLLSTGLLGLGGFVRMRIKNGAASKA